MKRLLLLSVALLTLNILSGCRHGCDDRPRLFDRGREREGSLQRIRDRFNDRDDDDCNDDCRHRPVSRNGYPGLGAPLTTPGGLPYYPGGSYPIMPGGIIGSPESSDPRVLPQPMPNIPPAGVPEGPAAQPFPAGPSTLLPPPSNSGGRPVSK